MRNPDRTSWRGLLPAAGVLLVGVIFLAGLTAAPKAWRGQLALVFSPGLSTREQVTETSGRGVGMDVVRANINALGGLVDLAQCELCARTKAVPVLQVKPGAGGLAGQHDGAALEQPPFADGDAAVVAP